MSTSKPLFFLAQIAKKVPWPRHGLGTRDGQSGAEGAEGEELRPRFGLAAKKLRAIDLSCRACDACGAGAGCWAWIPVRGTFAFKPPNSDCWSGSQPLLDV